MASNVGNEWEAKERSRGGDDVCPGEAKKRAKRMSASLLSQQALLSFAALQDRRALLQTHIDLGSFTG
jgi:hypothetical protein